MKRIGRWYRLDACIAYVSHQTDKGNYSGYLLIGGEMIPTSWSKTGENNQGGQYFLVMEPSKCLLNTEALEKCLRNL